MPRKKKKQNLNVKNIIAYCIIIVSFILFFRLFFIGGILYNALDFLIGNFYLFIIIISLYSLLTLINKVQIITIMEWIGVILFVTSINLISQKGFIVQNITHIFSIIITENLTYLIYIIILFSSIILLLSRYKSIIIRELQNSIKKTNYKIIDYKEKVEEVKNKKFYEEENESSHNCVSNFISQLEAEQEIIFKGIPDNNITLYANSIYQYIENIKNATINVFEKNSQEIIFTSEIISMEEISLKFKTKDIINRKNMIVNIEKIISNSKITEKGNIWTLNIKYKSNILLAIKDYLVTYYEQNKMILGISNFGNIVNGFINESMFLNFENIYVLNKFLDILFLEKSIANEKFIIIDLKNEILNQFINKESVLFERIDNINTIKSLFKYIENDILEKNNYALDLGYKSYSNYASAQSITYDKINIVFHEVATISFKSDSKLYQQLKRLVRLGSEYGYIFTFTNSKESKEIINSNLFKSCKNKLYFETYSNSFSKLLIKSKQLKDLNSTFAFYIYENEHLRKVYFPGNDTNKDFISNLIDESLEKDKFFKSQIESMWILDEIIAQNIPQNIISVTYLITKYDISKDIAAEIIEKYKQKR